MCGCLLEFVALGYAGQYTDAESGLIYLRARYYDPSTGQFLSRDPITATTGAPYNYTYNNPLNFVDPLGLETHAVCAGAQVGFLIHFEVQACVAWDNHGGVGVTGSVGAGAGTPAVGVDVGYQESNADHVRDLNGPFDYLGGSVGPVGYEEQYGHSCSGKHITVKTVTLGKSWTPWPEAHAGISATGVLSSGGTDPCDPSLPPFNPFHPFGEACDPSRQVRST